MTDAPERGDDRSRGESSKSGYGEADKPHPAQDKPVEPKLSPPAEEEKNPPTHPELVGGLGEGGPAPEAPVPRGDPQKESDRTDIR